MNLKLLQQSTVPLFLSTIMMALFYWQFNKVYPFIIEHFTDNKLSTLYAHLLIYIFLIHTLFVSLTNLINNIVIKSKIFVAVTIAVLFIYYLLSFTLIKDVLNYFMVSKILSENSIMGMVFFVVGTIGYSIFSVGILFFRKNIPYSYILLFSLLGLTYSAWFIDSYCYPIGELFSRI